MIDPVTGNVLPNGMQDVNALGITMANSNPFIGAGAASGPMVTEKVPSTGVMPARPEYMTMTGAAPAAPAAPAPGGFTPQQQAMMNSPLMQNSFWGRLIRAVMARRMGQAQPQVGMTQPAQPAQPAPGMGMAATPAQPAAPKVASTGPMEPIPTGGSIGLAPQRGGFMGAPAQGRSWAPTPINDGYAGNQMIGLADNSSQSSAKSKFGGYLGY